VSTKEREEYLMTTDPKHESNIGFYRFPDNSPTLKPPTRSWTPIPALIEVQQQQLTWVDVAALIVIVGPLRQYVKCFPLSVVQQVC
jgi:hypothetical protein